MFINRQKRPSRRLQWKLTLSYTAVTVGSLLVVVLILGYLLFSSVLVPLEILNTVLSPEGWIQIVSRNAPSTWRYVLTQKPVDTRLLSMMLEEGDLQVTQLDLLRVGDLHISLRTTGQGSVVFVDPDGIVLAASSASMVAPEAIGQPVDLGILPGLEGVLNSALSGSLDPQQLFVTIEPNERFYFAIPYFDKSEQDVLGAGIIYFESLPTEKDLPANMLTLLTRSVLILLLAAGLVGTIFGALTARGLVKRLKRFSAATDAWSKGDFSEFITDPANDEISQLAARLNHMAQQLQQFLKRSQEMAVSEERNRLARDLHDSAKQEALAASFHLGTALALFDRDPKEAKNHLLEADNLVDSVRAELTDLIHELRPPSANGARFDETVNAYVIEWAHQTGIAAALHIQGDAELPLEIKQAIYRIMQEALANVARHSSAENVVVGLEFQNNTTQLSIADDGSGFDTQGHYDGMGLESMCERAQSLNGDLSIESEEGQGTRVSVTFPTI